MCNLQKCFFKSLLKTKYLWETFLTKFFNKDIVNLLKDWYCIYSKVIYRNKVWWGTNASVMSNNKCKIVIKWNVTVKSNLNNSK